MIVHQEWGMSNKIGPVYYDDRYDRISSQKQAELDAEIHR